MGGDDQRLGDGAGGNQEFIFGFDRGDASGGPRFIKYDRCGGTRSIHS
ncbi:hypothetical protein [Mesorhizobium sp. Cs1321R2N1]